MTPEWTEIVWILLSFQPVCVDFTRRYSLICRDRYYAPVHAIHSGGWTEKAGDAADITFLIFESMVAFRAILDIEGAMIAGPNAAYPSMITGLTLLKACYHQRGS